MINSERKKLRDKVVLKGRSEIRRKIKEGSYMEDIRKENKILNKDEFISNADFLQEMITQIEYDRLRRVVYDKNYQRIDLNDWKRMINKKIRNRMLREKNKSIILTMK